MYLRDESRFIDHRDVLTPPPESDPVLAPDHDYYTIWDCHRGGRTDEAGAVVEDSVVAEGATVRSDAHVLRSVLLGPTSAEPRESIVGEYRAEPIG